MTSTPKPLYETCNNLALRKATISTITDKILEGMAEWQSRPLDDVCPVVFIDAIHVEIRVLSTIL